MISSNRPNPWTTQPNASSTLVAPRHPSLTPPSTSTSVSLSRVSTSQTTPSTPSDTLPSTSASASTADPHTPTTLPLSRFAPTYTPRWLLDVSAAPAIPVPLPPKCRPKRMLPDSEEVWDYTDKLFPRRFLTHVVEERMGDRQRARSKMNQAFKIGAPQSLNSYPGTFGPLPRVPAALPAPPVTLPRLSATDYASRFLPLLASEHSARVAQLKAAQMYLTNLTLVDRSTGLWGLAAPSIREGWPPVNLGDMVGIRRLWPESLASDGLEWEARVVSLRRADGYVHLECPQLRDAMWNAQHWHLSVCCNISFRPEDGVFFTMDWAVERVEGRLDWELSATTTTRPTIVRKWLFPEPNDRIELTPALKARWQAGTSGVKWKDPGLNEEQRLAILNFLFLPHPIPFLISGPPGTGKTKTCVETIFQILANCPTAHILVCGASNPSSDTLALRLKAGGLRPDQLLRLNGTGRPFDEINMELLPFCCIRDEAFALPPLEEVLAKRVVVTSCLDAGVLDVALMANSTLQKFHRFVRVTFDPTASTLGGPYPASTSPGPMSSTELRVSKPVPPHWTHLLIDEAAQATEPELAVPIAVVLPDPKTAFPDEECCKILLCGDVKQLGPGHVVGESSRQQELDLSLLGRLLDRPVYTVEGREELRRRWRSEGRRAWGVGDGMNVVHLTKNYRSHPAVLMLPSTLFYNDTLETFAPVSTLSTPLARWSRLPRPDFPLFFRSVATEEDMVHEGASWFNNGELDVVVGLVKELVLGKDGGEEGNEMGVRVKAQEISVVTPFREQVWKVRVALRKLGLGGVDVGNVEALQGAENRVVIISTVRSLVKDRIEEDRKRNRGLIFEAQRFNVALTRAKELLIVVGNAATLTIDPNWRSFYRFTRRMGAYEGDDVPGLEDDDAADVSILEEQFRSNDRDRDDGMLTVGSVVRATLRDVL